MRDKTSTWSARKVLRALLRSFFIDRLPGVVKPIADASVEPVSAYLEARLEEMGVLRPDVIDVFRIADETFLARCDDSVLQQAILSKPHSELPALKALATRLPEGMDRPELERAIREQFQQEWGSALSDARLDKAATLYTDCLDDALVMVEEQRVSVVNRRLGQLIAAVRESLSLQQDAARRSNAGQSRERKWLRPVPPRPASRLVGRTRPINELLDLLRPGKRAAITAAVQGAPGVGKTFLAEHLAVQVSQEFEGGVLFERCGFGFRHAQSAMPVLRRWASFAFGGEALPETDHVSAESVRALMAGHGAILVVLDDIWDVQAVEPLIEALPAEVCLLVTTRLTKIAEHLRATAYALDVLPQDEAVALLLERLGADGSGQRQVLEDLAAGLGGHALALTIAAGTLQRWPVAKWPSLIQRMLLEPASGAGFTSLAPADEEHKVDPVERVLSLSYFELSDEGRARFRRLGVFAADAEFDTDGASIVWECTTEEAERQLRLYVDSGLLHRGHSDHHWQMHGLLRAYALALLRRSGEDSACASIHASHYAERAKGVAKERRFKDVPQDYQQIAHAFAWAVEHDPSTALDLVSSMAPYQAAYQLREDGLRWAQRLTLKIKDKADRQAVQSLTLLAQAHDRIAGEPEHGFREEYLKAIEVFSEAQRLARALGLKREYARVTNALASTLRRVGDLPGEQRRDRLLTAFGAQAEAMTLLSDDDELQARVLNDQAIVLKALAECELESRPARLGQALASYDRALVLLSEEKFSPERGDIRNNMGNVLRGLADCPDHDARRLLTESMKRYDEALLYRLPDVRPLEHAMTMHNRAKALRLLALIAGSDRSALLELAQKACDTAVSIRRLGYGGTELRPAMRTSVRLWLELSGAIPHRRDELVARASEELAVLVALSSSDLKRYDPLGNALLEVEVQLRLSEAGVAARDHLEAAEVGMAAVRADIGQDPGDAVRASVLQSRIARAQCRLGEAATVGVLDDMAAAITRAERAQSTTLLSEALVEYAWVTIELGTAPGEPTEGLWRAREAVQRVQELAAAGALTVAPEVLEAAVEATSSTRAG